MNKEQKEVQQALLNNEKEVLKLLENNYNEALKSINEKLAVLLGRADSDMQYVIYQVEYQNALRTQIQAILEQLQTNEFETISEYLTKSYEDGFIGTMYDLQKQGIPLIFPIDQKQVVEAIQHETKLSTKLYTALGKDVKVLQKQIAGEISRGISQNYTYAQIAKSISNRASISRNNSMRIARTEAHRIQNKATSDAQFKAKEKGADVVKQWDSTLDSRTRESHRKLDGQIRELEDPFIVNGHKAMRPGDFGRPEEDINCRCVLLQRARWALEEDIEVTKYSEDAPVTIYQNGSTTQYIDMSDAKDYKDFKEKYKKAIKSKQGEIQEYYSISDDFKEEEKKEILKGIEYIEGIFGKEVRNYVTVINKENPDKLKKYEAYYTQKTKEIHFNEKTEIDDYKETMVHEFTHAIQDKLQSEYKKLGYSSKTVVSDELRKEIFKANGMKFTKANVKKYVSDYAAENSEEFISECVAVSIRSYKFNKEFLENALRIIREKHEMVK